MESKADILYKQLIKDGYTNLGTPEEFKIKVKNRDKADLLFKQLTKDGYTNLGNFDDFYSKVSQAVPVKKKEQQAPAKNQDGTESKSVTGLSEQPGLNPFGIGKKVRNDFETTLKAVELGVTPLELKNAKQAEIPVEKVPEMGDMERAALSTEPVRYKPKTFEDKTKEFAVDEDKYSANKESIDNIVLPPEALAYLDKNKTVVGSRGLGQSVPIKNMELEKKLKAWYALNPEGQKEYEFHKKVLNHGRDVIDKAEEIVNQKIIEATDEWKASMVQEAQYDPTGKNVYKEKPTRLLVLEAEADKIKSARKTLDAYKDAKTASTAAQIWNQIGRQIGDVATDAASFGLIPMSKDLTFFNLKKKQDEGKPLTEDEKRLLDTAAYAEYITQTYAGTATFAQDAVTAIGHSIPYMVSFASLGGLAKMATKGGTGALKASVQLAARQGLPNAMARVTGAQTSTALQVASKLSGAIGTRGAAVLTDAIDNVAKAGIQVMIDPRTYDKTIKNMTGNVGFNVTDEGKVTFTGFENDLSFPQALVKAYTSQMVENLSEYSGGLLGTATRPLSRWTSKNIPALSRMVNKTKFTGTTKKFMDAAGFHGIVPEFFEEQLATIGHAITGDGEGDWKDLTDPRQQLVTLTTVAAIGSGASMASAGIRKIGKDTAEFAFNDAINDLKAEFGDDFVELGKSMTTNSVTVNQESLREILDNPGYSNKQKMAAYNYYVAGNRYYAYKENFDEEAAKKSEEEQLEERRNEQIIENVLTANKGIGYEQAIEIANAEIDLRSLASNDTESGNITKQNIKKYIQDAIQKSKTKGGVLRYEQSEMGLQEVGKRDEGQKPSETATQEKEVRPREAVIAEIKQTDTDMETRIAEAQQRLGLPTIVPVAISEETEVTLDIMDNDEPVANEFVEKASAELYERYQELEKMKASDNRQFTVEQIDSMMEFIGEEITKLENYATKQRETGEFVRPSEVGTTTQRRAEEAPAIPATEEVTLAAPVAATEAATPQSAPEVTQELPAAEVTQAEVSTPAPKEKIARRKTPSTIQFDAPVVRQEVLQSLKLTFPDVEVVMDSDLEAAQQAVKEKLIAKGVSAANAEEVVTGMTADSGRIFNVKGKPAIIFLNPLLMNDRTIGHEFWHGILTDAFGENQPMFEKFQKAIDKRLRDSGYKAVADKLTSFAEGYEPGQLDFEEYLAEFGGYLTQEGFNTDKLKASEKSLLMQIKQVINKFAKAIFGQNVFMEDATAENILEFMIAASEKMKAGEAVLTKRGTRADGQGATTRAQAYDGIVSGVNSVISFINDNNVLDNSGLSTFKAQKANDFMSLSEKTNLYKKAFGERASRAIRDMMPIAFDMQDKLIPYLKELIPIKSHTEFIIKNYGTVIQKKFIDKVLGGGQIVTQNEIRNPEDVLKSVGYKFSYTKNESDILGFRGYYPEEGRNGVDVICTFNDPGGRAKANYVVFIVKDDATTTVRAQDLTQDNLNDSWKKYLEEKGRKNEDGTYNLEGIGNNREDPFSTSVLSIQIPKRGGNAKIISRYNHTISEGSVNPDATFGGDLNKIADGLTSSMENYFGLRINEKTSNDLPDFITQDDEGRLFNYEKEVNGIYYGVDFYIDGNLGESFILDAGQERMIDGFRINQNGRISRKAVDYYDKSIILYLTKIKKIEFLKDGDIQLTTEEGSIVLSTEKSKVTGIKYIDKKVRYGVIRSISEVFSLDLSTGNITIGDIDFRDMGVFKLIYDTDIVSVDGPLSLFNTGDFNPFKSIVSVSGTVSVVNSSIHSLGKLTYVGMDLDLDSLPNLKSFGDLMFVGGSIDIYNVSRYGNQIEANNLIFVGDSLNKSEDGNVFSELKNLTLVGGRIMLQQGIPIDLFPSLRYAGSGINIIRSKKDPSLVAGSLSILDAAKKVAPKIEFVGDDVTIDGETFPSETGITYQPVIFNSIESYAKELTDNAVARVTAKSQKQERSKSNYELIPGYGQLIDKVNVAVQKAPYQREEGKEKLKEKRLEAYYEQMLEMLGGDMAYAAMTDTQREEFVIRMREMIGLRVTPSPSTMIPRMLGHIKDIKNVTMDELELLKLKLTSEIRGVKNYNKARDKAWNQISQELKDMVSKNTIAQKQAINILRKFQKTNLLDEIETEKFLDYVAKVFADSNYVEYISSMNKKRSAALLNLKDKVGNATAFIDLATKMLSINPELITLRSISRYTGIVNILGSNRSVLPLQDRDEMMRDMIDVIQTVEETYEHALNLAITFAEFEDKVYDEKTGNLSFARTIAKMLENQVDELGNVVPGVIDQYDYDIMKKYRSVILSEYYGVIGESEEYQRASQEQKDELKRQREEEAAAFRKRIIYTIIKSDVSEDNLENVESRKSARELIALIKNRNYLERMSTTDLKILSSVLSNINDGFFPHSAQKMKEKMKAIGKAIDAVDVFERIKMGTFSGIRARIKSKFSKNESAYYSLIVSNPMGVIDEALGNFKGREVYNTFIKDMASGYSVYKSEYDDIQTMLDKSLDSLAKEAGGNMNKMVERQFFMMAYALQREYENNKGSRQVVSPFATIEETIKAATSDVSYYGEREAKILQDILTKFGKDDNVTLDADAMYQEMSPVEKDFMDNILPKINASLAPKASYTAGVLRDNAIGLLNNYIHHTVLGVGKKASQAIIENKALSEVNTFINSMKPSTRSKLLIERDGKVHPIMFNIYAAASASAKSVLLDFHMTEPARVINRTTHNVLTEMRLRENESRERQKGGADANTEQAVRDKIKQVREIMGAVDTAVEQVLRDTVMAAVGHETAMERALNAITKQGIRSMLGSARRAMQELGSNVLYLTHYTDVAKEALSKNMSDYTYTHEGRYVMEAVGSSNIQRLYPSGTISGSMVEASQIGAYYGIKQGRTINPTVNAMLTIHNLSTKKVKNFAENVADALISTPDRFLSRQVWFGSFGTEFRRLTGEDVNMEKVKEQDEEYMTVYGEQLQAAKDYADLQSIRASATDNPFLGIIKTTIEPASKNWFMTFFKTFDKFLIRFQIFEFSAARAGIMSMVGKGMMSKEDGFRLLSAVMMRSMGYATLGILTKQAMSNLVVGMFGLKGDDEESDKDVSQAVTQGFFTALISFMLGRNLGNTWRGAVNYPVELMNQKYFSGIIRGDREYDMYKDQVTYSFIPAGDLRGKDVAWETAKSMTAGYSPLVKAISYSAKKGIYVFSGTSKDRAAYERALKDLYIRTPLEILGLAGYIPLYNDIRKVTLDVLYDDLKGNEKKESYKSEAEKAYLKSIGK